MLQKVETKELPILFQGQMVVGVLEDRKHMTRRTKGLEEINKDPGRYEFRKLLEGPKLVALFWDKRDEELVEVKCPYGKPGSFLWVRESYHLTDDGEHERAVYAADEVDVVQHTNNVRNIATRLGLGDEWLKRHTKLRPSIHMPRWASRIILEITDIRVERLQDISEEDAEAEGVNKAFQVKDLRDAMHKLIAKAAGEDVGSSYRLGFAHLWDEINGPDSWSANPWVWCISFRKVRP